MYINSKIKQICTIILLSNLSGAAYAQVTNIATGGFAMAVHKANPPTYMPHNMNLPCNGGVATINNAGVTNCSQAQQAATGFVQQLVALGCPAHCMNRRHFVSVAFASCSEVPQLNFPERRQFNLGVSVTCGVASTSAPATPTPPPPIPTPTPVPTPQKPNRPASVGRPIGKPSVGKSAIQLKPFPTKPDSNKPQQPVRK